MLIHYIHVWCCFRFIMMGIDSASSHPRRRRSVYVLGTPSGSGRNDG